MTDIRKRRALELMRKYYGGIIEDGQTAPELESVSISGTILNFNTDIVRPLKSLILNIEPHQSGSGNPSPSNIRPISGYDAVNVYRSGSDTSNPAVYSISMDIAGTVYGGTLDVKSGRLTVTHTNIRLTSTNQTWTAIKAVGTGLRYYARIVPEIDTNANNILCSHAVYSAGNDGNWGTYNLYNGRFAIKNNDGGAGFTSLADFKTWLDSQDFQICYPLATPQTYQLTPTEVTTLMGYNTIWMDAEGTIDAEYWRIRQ